MLSIPAGVQTDPRAPGLLAIGVGGVDSEEDDRALLAKCGFIDDALHAWCRRDATTEELP
ncbi:MAG: hypothetical protein ACKOI2_14880 [Actinomycetota bacterium]